MRKVLLKIIILIGLTNSLLSAFGHQESVSYTQTGIIVLVGNEPHLEIVLKGGDGNAYLLTGKKAEELIPYQNQEVAVTGEFRETGGINYKYELEVDFFSSELKPMILLPSR